MSPVPSNRVSAHPTWGQFIPDDQWAVYHSVIRQARAHGVRYAVGGAFGAAVYTGQLRNTKDFDFYILPADREAMKQAMTEAGLGDYFESLPYDRSWIYRGNQGDIIVDAIWAMANHRAEVDERWLTHGPEFQLREERLRAIPVEELIWSKLYVLQRERCDWGDVLNLVDAQAEALQWDHLLDRLDDDARLLAGAMSVFAWLAPDRSGTISQAVWNRLGLRPPKSQDPVVTSRRADLLDSRPWFIRLVR